MDTAINVNLCYFPLVFSLLLLHALFSFSTAGCCISTFFPTSSYRTIHVSARMPPSGEKFISKFDLARCMGTGTGLLS